MTKATSPAPEPITPIAQHSIPKLSERAIGQMTYQIGVGDSGTVYLAVTANEGGGYFSAEWVALPRLQERLAAYRDSGQSFPTPVLRAAYSNRSINNGGFLAAILRHLGLLKPGDPAHQHVLAEGWSDWEATQRQYRADGACVAVAAPDPMAKPLTRQRQRAKRASAPS
ncbi:hypothetical protein [Thiocystis violacea]|uniref:hypothetical protein n=1 Tax=Thiocystis violacea TaxID=13725 RepID=UPI0019030500|nr:hypothetical protein [Thiocystis violacea]MBK1719167.1 hypothetical protein [Thiocystis violacea]